MRSWSVAMSKKKKVVMMTMTMKIMKRWRGKDEDEEAEESREEEEEEEDSCGSECLGVINPPSCMREAGYSSRLVCASCSDLLKYTMLVVAMDIIAN